MGSFTSNTFEDLIEEEPVTPVTAKRVLTFDPRSPSTGISRTPIQVEKTPDRLIDPRSPTCGIPRTPILNCEQDQNNCATQGSPARHRRHSFSEGSPTHFDGLSMKEALESLPPLDFDMDSPDRDNKQLLVRSTSEPELAPPSPPKEKPNKAESKTPGKVARQRKPKVLFRGNTNVTEIYMDAPRSPLGTITAPHQRSPLGWKKNKDINSPLSIVQRKQSNKLGMLKSQGNTPVKSAGNSPCRLEAMTAVDKENISM